MKTISLAVALVSLALALPAHAQHWREWDYALLVIEGNRATINKRGEVAQRELRSNLPEEPTNPEYQLREKAKREGWPDDGRKRDERGTLVDILEEDFGNWGYELVSVVPDGKRTVYYFKRVKP
jgi:hypothetical protein